MFFLLRKIPHIPSKKRVIDTARYFTKSIGRLFLLKEINVIKNNHKKKLKRIFRK
jgi:hypothetical protein